MNPVNHHISGRNIDTKTLALISKIVSNKQQRPNSSKDTGVDPPKFIRNKKLRKPLRTAQIEDTQDMKRGKNGSRPSSASNKAKNQKQVLHFKNFQFNPYNVGGSSNLGGLESGKSMGRPKSNEWSSSGDDIIAQGTHVHENTTSSFPRIGGDNFHPRVSASASSMKKPSSRQKVLVFYRSEAEKHESPERLNLDRRNLNECPILEDEQQLKLLNFQYNNISHIDNLKNLPNLIFLDLYNNKIRRITNLHYVPTLRVLMLGKNEITRIEGIEALKRLDVLDLHNNHISSIENIGHLKELRVLNLAGNKISRIENIRGLEALTEINLRRNRIEYVDDVHMLPNLQRVFLSNNHISNFNQIAKIFEMKNLMELSFDGNPVTKIRNYRLKLLHELPTLRHLDAKHILEEEKQNAKTLISDTPKHNDGLPTTEKMKRASTVHHENELPLIKTGDPSALIAEIKQAYILMRPKNSSGQSASSSNMHTGGKYYVDAKGSTIHIYGAGANVDSYLSNDLSFNPSEIEEMVFEFVDFSYILEAYLPRMRAAFPNASRLILRDNGLRHLHTMESLASIYRGWTHLTIEENPVCGLTMLLRNFVICAFDKLRTFNGVPVTSEERAKSGDMFNQRRVISRGFRRLNSDALREVNALSYKYVDTILYHAFTIDKKMKTIDDAWETVVRQIVSETLTKLQPSTKK